MATNLLCPACQSEQVKRNGHIHNGKQNYQCQCCARQFVEEPTKKYISGQEKQMINKLLLERISLAGICRVMAVSKPWLLDYVAALYESLPADLNALPFPPPIEQYLEDNFDKLIYELLPLKKTLCRMSLQLHGKILTTIQQMN